MRNFSMYDSGKIYVVIAVLAVVLLGFFIYLFNMDRKIKSLEQKIKSNE
jgi:CcmD family protein